MIHRQRSFVVSSLDLVSLRTFHTNWMKMCSSTLSRSTSSYWMAQIEKVKRKKIEMIYRFNGQLHQNARDYRVRNFGKRSYSIRKRLYKCPSAVVNFWFLIFLCNRNLYLYLVNLLPPVFIVNFRFRIIPIYSPITPGICFIQQIE